MTILLLIGILAVLFMLGRQYLQMRGHGGVNAVSNVFTESARSLQNPSRGFYHMHGFRIKDEAVDFQGEITKRFHNDAGTKLTLIQINLQHFREGVISQQGLANVEALFEALANVDKQLIIRFLYDWNGENEQYEPESLDVILTHMQQLEPVLREYSDRIFLVQGLFIGNWGEMNGTRFLATEDLQALAKQLAAVTEDSTFLSVRMPAQWRKITQLGDPAEVVAWNGELSSRLGLYNDGMLGSWSDYGTYGDQTQAEHGSFTYWNREEELAFQEVLCRKVPNGGEVIVDNAYNDWKNAIADMKQMHVTYLNRDYDTRVLDKWANTIVTEEGCFQGMDGLTYVERHLGYRLVLRETQFKYDLWEDSLAVDVVVQNVGFAPVYRETAVNILLRNETDKSGVFYSYALDQDIRTLSGGTQEEMVLHLQQELSMKGMSPGRYTVYLELRDVLSGERILFGNEQDVEEYGYRLGEVEIQSVDTFWEAAGASLKAYLTKGLE